MANKLSKQEKETWEVLSTPVIEMTPKEVEEALIQSMANELCNEINADIIAGLIKDSKE